MEKGSCAKLKKISLCLSFSAAAVITIFVLIFFAGTVFQAFAPAFQKDGNASSVASGSSDFASLCRILFFTVKQAFFSTLLAIAVGIPAAYFLSCKKFFFKPVLQSLSSVSLCIPPLLVALGFVMTFGMNGVINNGLQSVFNLKEPPFTFLYSFTGIVIVHGFYNFPIIMRTVSDTWKNLPASPYEAALLSGCSRFRIFRTVTFFQILPSIVTGASIVFLYCFFSFIIVLLFGQTGVSTVEVEIYRAAKTTLDFSKAAKLALIETFTASFIILFYANILKRGNKTRNDSGRKIAPNRIDGFFEEAAAILLFAMIFLFLCLPLLMILFKAPAKLVPLFSSRGFSSSLRNTVITAFSTGILCVITAFFYAALEKAGMFRNLFCVRFLTLIPMAVSSVVIGFGITNLMRKTNFTVSPALLVLCQTSLAWPFAYQQIKNQMDKIPQDVTDAAKLLSPDFMDSYFRILFPLCKRGLLSGFAFTAAISLGDATLPLTLSLNHFETLSLYTYRLAGAYRFPEACAAGSVLIISGIILFVLADFFASDKRIKNGRN